MCVYVCVYVCVCMYVCMYVYTERIVLEEAYVYGL